MVFTFKIFYQMSKNFEQYNFVFCFHLPFMIWVNNLMHGKFLFCVHYERGRHKSIVFIKKIAIQHIIKFLSKSFLITYNLPEINLRDCTVSQAAFSINALLCLRDGRCPDFFNSTLLICIKRVWIFRSWFIVVE